MVADRAVAHRLNSRPVFTRERLGVPLSDLRSTSPSHSHTRNGEDFYVLLLEFLYLEGGEARKRTSSVSDWKPKKQQSSDPTGCHTRAYMMLSCRSRKHPQRRSVNVPICPQGSRAQHGLGTSNILFLKNRPGPGAEGAFQPASRCPSLRLSLRDMGA